MGIFKPLDLVPKRVHLLPAILLELRQRRPVINQLTVVKNTHLQSLYGKVRIDAPLPCGLRVKQLQRLALIHRFVPEGNVIRLCLSGSLIKNPIDFLEMRIGDFRDVFANFNLRYNRTIWLFNRNQLINPAKYRCTFSGNHSFSNPEHINLCVLCH